MLGGGDASTATTALAVPGTATRSGTGPSKPKSILPSAGGWLGTLIWIGAFAGLYLLWSAIQSHKKVGESLKPENIRANLHNLAVIWLAVVITVPLSLVAFVKIGALFPWARPVTHPAVDVISNA